jgi:phenylalanyl-tRNA synthetase alpha chain
MSKIDELEASAVQELGQVGDPKALEAWRVQYLGRKGALTEVLRGLAGLSLEERRVIGARANQVKATLETRYQEAHLALAAKTEAATRQAETLDITLPGYPFPAGHQHPLTQAIDEICDIFHSMGFEVALGPDAEWDYYNFEALNIPKEHPARDSMSTLWVDYEADNGERSMLLRTHCTAVSARVIHTMKPPIRVIEPGMVYRYEATDATHLNAYHNVDGLVVDKGITMADLKGTLYEFARRYFGPDRKVRFRCDYFPFVEPGVEMAIECAGCRGEGCRLCSNSGWLEILGAGMTHPDVLRRGGIDPDAYTSFAFGMGLERLPMLRYGIDDMRLYYGSDLRFLRQF